MATDAHGFSLEPARILLVASRTQGGDRFLAEHCARQQATPAHQALYGRGWGHLAGKLLRALDGVDAFGRPIALDLREQLELIDGVAGPAQRKERLRQGRTQKTPNVGIRQPAHTQGRIGGEVALE